MGDEQATPQQDLPSEDDRTREQQESASGGADSPEDKAEQRQGDDTGGTAGGSPEGESDQMQAAKKAKEEEEKAKEKVKELEEDPPEKLEDWPDDKAKYETFGGPEGDEDYEESVTSKLGPSGLRYRDDGSVEIEGEKVDDPDEYKAEPIPGGPTDPRASDTRAYGEPDLTEETSIDPEAAASEDDEGDGSEGGDEDGGESEGGDGQESDERREEAQQDG